VGIPPQNKLSPISGNEMPDDENLQKLWMNAKAFFRFKMKSKKRLGTSSFT
jgi:hypothetical protein